MKKLMFAILIVFTGGANFSCTGNILTAFQKEDDASLYTDALLYINDGDYSAAILNFQQMSSGFLFVKEVAYHHAGAYAGRGGYNLLGAITDISGIGATPLLNYAMATYIAADATTSADLITAADIINTYLGSAVTRRDDDNIFQIVLSFVKMGHILSHYADADDNGVSDWVATDACSAANLPDTEARAIATGISSILESIAAVGSLPGLNLTDVSTACTVLPANYNFCAVTDPAALTADQIKGVRTLIQEGDTFGIGPCTSAADAATTCLCP